MSERPFVYINMAMSVDGKITSATREYPRFTSDYDRRSMDRLRAEADALVVGAGTVRADDPPLHVRDAEMLAYRKTLGRPAGLLKVVVSASLRGLVGTDFLADRDGGGCIIATSDDAPTEELDRLPAHAEVWRLGSRQVDIGQLVRRLRDRGVERLLVEGGGELNGLFVEQDLVDEIYITIAPTLLGGRDAPTPVESLGLTMANRRRLRLLNWHCEAGELYCRYVVER
jgi:2,5-diamino-6-(ribosylamino)-4(3H)-pyrimidinone 5'-phosphate reductase